MSQSISNLNALPVIETILGASPSIVVTRPAEGLPDQDESWKALEERIRAWAPASGEPDVQKDEDGYLLPSSRTRAVALEIVARLRDAGVAIPMRLGQTANGGINFEWRCGASTERLTVNARGEAELAKFENSKLISRTPIALAIQGPYVP